LQQLARAAAELLADQPQTQPGPGEYETGVDMGPRHCSNRGLSCFQEGSSHLPRTWRPTGPGPGDYERPLPERPGSSTSVPFASVAPRFPRGAPKAPGPAFYSPRKQSGQSFHLNLQSQWV